MLDEKCQHEWKKHTNVKTGGIPATYICKKCNTEMAAGVVFQLEEMQTQTIRHSEILQAQNEYNQKQLWWSRMLAFATWGLVIATLLLAEFN